MQLPGGTFHNTKIRSLSMKTKINPLSVFRTHRLLRSLPLPLAALVALLTLSPVGALRADAPSANLGIFPTGTDTEGLRSFLLDWNAAPNAMYGIQASADLSSWKTVDSIIRPDAVGSYQFSVRATDTSGFYRLALPKPQITAVEPAVVDVSVPNAQIYILGQCLPNNALVVINGITFIPTIINSGGVWARVSLNGLPPGEPWFDVTVVDPATGATVATLPGAVLGVDASSPYLLEPPEMPLASPSYGAAVKRSKSNVSNNRTSGGEGIRENDEVVFEIQDGKKGLNAVNVSLARGAGVLVNGSGVSAITKVAISGGGEELPKESLEFNYGHTTVMPFSGEVQACDVDMVIPGRGLDFIWTRIYSSRTGTATAMGQRWTHSYDVRCAQDTTGGMDVSDGTGRTDTYKLQANGTYTCPGFFREGTLTGGVFRLTFADTGYWEFNPLDPVSPDAKLARIVDRNGNVMSLNYDDLGHLTQIVDDLGRTNTVSYDSDGRVASVTDFSGRTVTYQYYQGLPGEQGGAGDLKSVTSPPVTGTPNGNDFPTGKTTTYTYSAGYLDDRENHLLLSVIDAKGQIQHQHVYQHNQTDLEFLRCISVQHWTNTPTMISYLPQTPTPANQFATMRCIVNGPVGDVTECYFDARNRPVKMQELTGRSSPGVRVTATENWPAGKVRAGDPDTYETRWSWNNDSLCTSEISPGGQKVQCVYESDFDKSTRALKRADCRLVREIASSPVDLDGDGVADVTERVWRFEYDPRFGSDSTVSRLRSGVIAEVGAGRPATVGRESIQLPQNCEIKAKSISGLASKTAALSAIGSIPIVGGLLRGASDLPASGARGINTPSAFTAVPDRVRRKLVLVSGSSGSSSLAASTGNGIKDVQVGEVCDDGNQDSGDGFVIAVTDPRGNVTTGSYDVNGNLKTTTSTPKKLTFTSANFDTPQTIVNFTYNPYGQVTAITNAPDANGYRRVDTFSYYTNGPQAGYLQSCVVDAGAGGLAIATSYEYDARGNLTRYMDPRGNDWLCTYNSLDQLVQTESAALGGGGPGGYRIKTQFSYDANDNLTLVAEENRDAAGTLGTNPFWRTQFVYDGGQRLTGCWRDKNGALVLRCTSVEYNAADQVVLYRSPEAVNGNDPLNTVAYEYDERGMLFREIGAPGSGSSPTNEWSYTANYNPATKKYVDAADSLTTSFAYDGFEGFGASSSLIIGNNYGPRIYKNAPSASKIPGAKLMGISTSQIHQSSLRFVMPFTVSGGDASSLRCSRITDPMGNVTTFHYDANDNLKVVRHFGELNDVPGSVGNIRLAESRYEYDGLDRPIRSRDSFFSLQSQATIGDGERTTTVAYAPNGECTSITDDLGRATTFAYDTAGRLSTISSSGGKTVFACFKDAAGNITQTTQTDQPDLGGPPQVFVWTNVYDALNRPVSTSDNVGNTNQFAYDSCGNCTSTTDPNGNETVYGYDGLSRTLSSTTYQGGTTTIVSSSQFAYDDNDNCVSSTDANANVTLHAYDSLDRLTQTTQADGTHHSLLWSPRSNLISETDADGTVITHTYDLNDRCIASHITPGSGVAATTLDETFTYDGASRMVSANNDASQSGFEYDSLGNCTRGVSGGVGAVVSPHDSMGRRTSLTYPGGRVLTYAYDVLDQCTSINENGAALASFSYAGPGRVVRVIYGNGTSTQVTYDGLSGTPNAPDDFGQGMVSSVTHAIPGAGGPQSFSAVNLKWDRNGNKTLRTDSIFAPAVPRVNTLGLQYDGADRLTRASLLTGTTLVRDTVYGLDAMGNRTNVTGAASCSGGYYMDGFSPGPMDLQMNQYTATPCDTRTYDNNGNLLSRSSPTTGPVTYQYDYAGRLVQVQALDFNSGSLAPVASYAYDALGRRISKTIYSGALPPVTTQFLYDGGGVIEERVNGAVAGSFVHASGLKEEIRENDNVVFEMRRGGQDYYFHTDDQGNTLALVDAQGVPVEFYNYDDYGAVTFLTSDGVATSATSSSVGNPYCWHGLRLDAETGLQNDDGGGYLDTQTGRNITVPWVPANPSIPHRISAGNNPWSGGGGGSPSAMKNGTVKFFNETKGFGYIISGSVGGSGSVDFIIRKAREAGAEALNVADGIVKARRSVIHD